MHSARFASMNVARTILSILLISCLGCTMSAVAPDDVSLTAVRTDRTVRLTLRNQSGSAVGYNLCTSGLQRRTADKWSVTETGDICTMEIRTLRSGASATFDKTLPDDVGSGQYRYATNVEWEGKAVVVTSDPFTMP
jgi:hypothetical protein